MRKPTVFIIQVFISAALILGVMAYTAAVSSAFVSPQTILQVIQVGGGR